MPLAELAGWVPQAGATGLLLVAVWLVLSGRIVPKGLHDEVRADRDIYRTAVEKSLAANAEQAVNVGRLVSAVEQLTAAQRETLDIVRRLAPPAAEDRIVA
jgi:hypothetical protein